MTTQFKIIEKEKEYSYNDKSNSI